MLTLPITKDQLLFLIDQLSETEKQDILQHLIQQQPLEQFHSPMISMIVQTKEI